MHFSAANILSPHSRLRVILDLCWVGAFSVVLLLMLGSSGATSADSSARLEMSEGAQRLGLYLKDKRMGAMISRIRKEDSGWQVSTAIRLGQDQVALTLLYLFQDLSLARLHVKADLLRLVELGGVPTTVFPGLKGEVNMKGDCALETGVCNISGTVAGHKVGLPIMAGRGPVLTNAVYPLLARGNLGKEVEIGLFDPLSFRRKLVTFRIEGREQLRLRSGRSFDAVRVSRDLDGVRARIWIDGQGRVLKEELPLGIVLEHESFELRETKPPGGES